MVIHRWRPLKNYRTVKCDSFQKKMRRKKGKKKKKQRKSEMKEKKRKDTYGVVEILTKTTER